jgi:hypothetical protein
MGCIMVVQPPDEEAEAEAEGGDRHARYFARRCAVPHGIVRCTMAIVTVAGRGYFEGVCDK